MALRGNGRRVRVGFTIIELVVVITVIVLILAIALPGLSAMSLQSRLANTTQTVTGALTRAYYAALGDVNLTVVRFVPGQWDFNEQAEAQRATGRQHMVTYSYAGTSAGDPANPNKVTFGEYFQRRERTEVIQLPEDIWVAPVEALDTGARKVGNTTYSPFGEEFVLTGTRGQFQLDAANTSVDFLKADDFVIAFDPQTGVRGGTPTPMRLKGYIPPEYLNQARGIEADRVGTTPYRRYSFSGIVVYRREPFVALGDDPAARQDWLRKNGRPYLVERFGGGLVMGSGE